MFCSFILQVHNVQFAFELMQDGGLAKPKARPEGQYKHFHSVFVLFRAIAVDLLWSSRIILHESPSFNWIEHLT